MGRWISQDPLGFDAGDSNLYRYVNNRATVAVDPSGLLMQGEGDDQAKVDKAKEKVLMYEPVKKLFNQVKKGLGALHVKADGSVTEGKWVPGDKTILVNPNAKGKTLESIIIFETLNASKNKSFTDLRDLAVEGKLSRIDFVIGIERIEFENVLEFRKIVKGEGAEAALGKKTVELFKEIDKSKDPWTLYLDSMFEVHSQNLGLGWTKLYKKAWDKVTNNADPDEPLKDISKKVDADWISDWRKVWKGK
jgi:hypothetical protein